MHAKSENEKYLSQSRKGNKRKCSSLSKIQSNLPGVEIVVAGGCASVDSGFSEVLVAGGASGDSELSSNLIYGE